MKLRVLGCYGGSIKGTNLSCYLLNDTIVLDAGSLTQTLTLEEQLRIRHVIITHSHLDHNSGLPFFAGNVFGRSTSRSRLAHRRSSRAFGSTCSTTSCGPTLPASSHQSPTLRFRRS
jgi:ribonuclease BN (tRNA processing enzyme)